MAYCETDPTPQQINNLERLKNVIAELDHKYRSPGIIAGISEEIGTLVGDFCRVSAFAISHGQTVPLTILFQFDHAGSAVVSSYIDWQPFAATESPGA